MLIFDNVTVERFFMECYSAYKAGRADTDPSIGWYKGEIGFFDFYIIPLSRKLKDCGVFGVSSDENLNYATENKRRWIAEGKGVVAVNFDWRMGTGQICFLSAFGLKCIDLLCNCCVATPIITRDRDEQWKYERLSEQAEQGIFVSDRKAKENNIRAQHDGSSDSYES